MKSTDDYPVGPLHQRLRAAKHKQMVRPQRPALEMVIMDNGPLYAVMCNKVVSVKRSTSAPNCSSGLFRNVLDDPLRRGLLEPTGHLDICIGIQNCYEATGLGAIGISNFENCHGRRAWQCRRPHRTSH